MTERIAVIDLGSNSARLIVMHIYRNGAYNLVYHQKEAVRLSEGMGTNLVLQPEAMTRAIGSLKTFAQMCELIKVDRVLAVATAAVRSATNRNEFLDRVYRETGIPLRAIGGEDEARLGFIGVINAIDIQDGVLFDLGGASTEVTLIRGRRARESLSLPFGALNLTERFVTGDKFSEPQQAAMRQFIQKYLDQLPWLKNVSLPLIGVGGTARNIAKMDQKRKNYPFPKVHNYRLGPIAFNDLWRTLVKSSLPQRRKFPGLSSERADIIMAGSTIVKCLMEHVNGSSLIISGCGVREGMFWEYYLTAKEPNAGPDCIIPDILDHSTQNMLRFYKGHPEHANQVALLADTLFEGWHALHRQGPRDRKLLRVAALLHDIGITINYYDHARHSAYLVENARLFGLTHREQMLAAVVAGWHHSLAAKYVRNRLYSEFLDEMDWQTVRRLSLLLAIAESLETTQLSIVKDLRATVSAGQARLTLLSDAPALLEREAVGRHKKWFRKELGVDLIIE
ncbi:MAG TPA: Ppx/GppA phosphatase family protein [Patescibacteria group bacterium]|nr:Ppx/GppA phosphatase family protein [Patescibacteria group bacterium]